MKKLILLLIILLIFVTAGCSSASPVGSANQGSKEGSTQPVLSGLNRDWAGPYGASFVVQFEGSNRWAYTLNTRKTAALTELSLHLDGIEGANNPGDIRLVTDGKVSTIIGPGTDNECMQFSNGEGMDPQWIFPESLISAADLSQFVTLSGEETVAGKTARHFSGSKSALGDWKNVKVDVWEDKSDQSLLRYTLEGQVKDPFFNKGTGKITARYEASDISGAVIAPIKGCELTVPLPDRTSKYVRLPGMASFESTLSLQDLQTFYQQRMPQEGWTEKDVPALADGSVVLSYTRNGEEVEIHLATGAIEGNQVKVLFGKVQ